MNPASWRAHTTALWEHPSIFHAELYKDKTVLVSGAGSGIGLAIALLFVRLGAKVAICGRSPEKLAAVQSFVQDHGAHILTHTADIREPAQITQLFAAIEQHYGALDILVNNAGGQFAQAAIDFSIKGWNAVVHNNLNGTWYMMQHAAQRWRDLAHPGVIVNIVAPTTRGMSGVAHTVAARAGIIGLMNTVAVEWAPLNIRVNCLSPGLTATSGLDVYPPEALRSITRANPMKRMGTAMEMAQSCVFLASPAASFITGTVLEADGGYRLWGELFMAGRPDYYREDAHTG